MSRAKILEDTIARLEAERYAPRPSWALPTPPRDPESLEDWGDLPVDPDAPLHRQVLLDALSGDAVVIAFREREASVDAELQTVGRSGDDRRSAPNQLATSPGQRPTASKGRDRVTSLPATPHTKATGGAA